MTKKSELKKKMLAEIKDKPHMAYEQIINLQDKRQKLIKNITELEQKQKETVRQANDEMKRIRQVAHENELELLKEHHRLADVMLGWGEAHQRIADLDHELEEVRTNHMKAMADWVKEEKKLRDELEYNKEKYNNLLGLFKKILTLMLNYEEPHADPRPPAAVHTNENPMHGCFECGKDIGHRGWCSEECMGDWQDMMDKMYKDEPNIEGHRKGGSVDISPIGETTPKSERHYPPMDQRYCLNCEFCTYFDQNREPWPDQCKECAENEDPTGWSPKEE